MTNILTQAKRVRVNSRDVSPEQAELYLAYLQGEITAGQAARVLGTSDTGIRTAAAAYLRQLVMFKRAKIVMEKE